MKSIKKAQGHVEMVLSFVIFISTVIFLFMIVRPFDISISAPSEQQYVEKAILENISIDIGRLTVAMIDPATSTTVTDACELLSPNPCPCYSIDLTDYTVPDITTQKYKEIPSNSFSSNIYVSEIFEQDSLLNNKPTCPEEAYSIGGYILMDVVNRERLERLAAEYFEDYEKLKNELGIGGDFMFRVRNTVDRSIIPELSVSKELPNGMERESTEIPVRVFDSSGNFEELLLNIATW